MTFILFPLLCAPLHVVHNLTFFLLCDLSPGLEEFEDKIDKIAGGADSGDGSWLGNLYKKFKGSFLDGNGMDDSDAAANMDNMDGLEPPILDETWGLDDVRTLYDSNSEFPYYFVTILESDYHFCFSFQGKKLCLSL